MITTKRMTSPKLPPIFMPTFSLISQTRFHLIYCYVAPHGLSLPLPICEWKPMRQDRYRFH